MGHDHRPPSFYHILMNPSSPHLPLPTKFVKKHLRNKILKDPVLKSANGGYLWKLKMKKTDDHTFCFVNGWCNVVKDLGLLFGEFLLFKYVGSSVFLMHVYGVNGCEKILVPRINNNFKVVVDDDEVSVFDDVEDEVSVFDDNDDVEDDDDYNDVEYDEDVAEEDEEDDDDDDDDDDEDEVDVDGDDGDPFFVITSSKRNKNKLRLPLDLVAMAYMYNKETITLKNDDGYEKEMPVRSYKLNKSARYYVAEGWEEFQRINNVSEGDECVLKFIMSEDKLCLAKVTKKKTRFTEVNNDDDDGMDEEGEAEDAKEDDSNVDGDDIFDVDVDDEGKGENSKLVNDDEDADEDDHDVDGEDGDPSFILTCSEKNQYKLWFSADFVALAGIATKETITLKNLDGYEKELHVRSHRNHQSKSYYLAGGWKEFQQNSKISEGDKFVFKFITSEDKFCVAKITKKRTPARSLPPAAKAPVTEVVDGLDDNDVNVDDGMDGKDVVVDDNKDEDENVELDSKDVVVDENKDEDDNVEPVDDGMDGKDVVVDENKDEDENVEPVDDGMDVQDVVVDDNKDEDENVEPVDDGMDVKDVVVDDNKDEDENVEPVDDGMDVKDVVVDENKDEDENVEPLDDGMDVVVDDNNDEDVNVEPVDDGMDGNDVVVDENKDEDENVEPVDDGMDGKDVVVDDNKNEDENVEPVDDGMVSKNMVVDDNKDEDDNVELVDDGMDVNADDNKDEDKDAEFVVTITPSHKSKLRLPTHFVASAGIESKENITMKSLDGNETQMSIRTDKQRHCSTRYHLSVGWPAFKRSNNISEGDECVFMYTTSEDKMSLAKISKIITPPTEVDDGMDGKDVVVGDNKAEDENVELADDGMDVDADNNKDAEFVATITSGHKSRLALPKDFVVLAGIESKENIIMKSLDGNETKMSIRTDKRHRSPHYHLSVGWTAFKRSNNISEGDECVFMYTTSEDKMSLAKISKKITPPTEADDNDLKVDDGMDGKDVAVGDNKAEDENVELVDNGMDVDADDDKDEDKDPEFVVTITPIHMSKLVLPRYFVVLAGIESKENIIMKSPDGNETVFPIRTDKRHRLTSYYLSVGWPAFKRSNNISEGDKCVFKYITSEDRLCLAKFTKAPPREVEDKMCLAKVTKEKTQTRLPSPDEVVKRKRGRLPPATEKRKRGRLPPSSPRVNKDVKRKRGC